MLLTQVKTGHKGYIKSIVGNENTIQFLSTLGCYEGEKITLISVLAGNYIINIKDSRYALDEKLAKSIEIAD